ncbi:MAG: hypothetical protein HYV26_06315 [Candidatus Hydrogenedentes bacterium]|nr:hypothetical protein [Candidatus Hydrogenedentota bacterium]
MSLRVIPCLLLTATAHAATFTAGYAERDITPQAPMPMWGYGARHALLAQSAADPLTARVIVLEAGGIKLAIAGLDLGRAPTFRSLDRIKSLIQEKAGVAHLMICGSHTHHGPVVELLDEPGLGQGTFDAAVKYVTQLEDAIAAAIIEAADKAVPAKLGWGAAEVTLNRNRQKKDEPKPRDPELAVLRFDTLDGQPIVLLVNFAAHPILQDIRDLRWTCEWPGYMIKAINEQLGAPCVFVQGAAGDMSPNPAGERTIQAFGAEVAAEAVKIARQITPQAPAQPGLQVVEDTFDFKTRLDLQNSLIRATFKQMFFPEILAMLQEIPGDTIHPRLITVVLNGQLALVGGSGEFFSAHARRLKAESPAERTLFFGYCNGHQMYFPTREAIDQGGYGTEPSVSWVEPGAGEYMIDTALNHLRALHAAS